jgi:importin subunit alpha-1
MLDGENNAITMCVIWLFVNLVSENKEIRDYFITSQLYNKILNLAEKETVINTYASHVATLVSNLHKQTSHVEPDAIILEKSTLLICSFFKLDNKEVYLDSLWALANLTNSENPFVLNIIAFSGAVEKLIEIMKNNMENGKIKCAFLKVIGNLSSGKDFIITYLISLNILDLVAQLFNDTFFAIRREAGWIFANVAAGSKDHVNFLIGNGYLDIIKQKLQDNNIYVVTEAVWFICNIISGSDFEMKLTLIAKYSILETLLECLKINNEKIVLLTLDSLKCIFDEHKKLNFNNGHSTENNIFAQQFSKIGGIDVLEKLQESESEKIYLKVYELIKESFVLNSI